MVLAPGQMGGGGCGGIPCHTEPGTRATTRFLACDYGVGGGRGHGTC